MILDSVVEEVRAIRDEIAKECDYDIDAIFEKYRQHEANRSVRHVSLSGRKIPQQEQSDLQPAVTAV